MWRVTLAPATAARESLSGGSVVRFLVRSLIADFCKTNNTFGLHSLVIYCVLHVR